MANKTEKQKTIEIFCANCQEDTAHTGAVDLNGELVFTCTVCDRFIKVPAGMSAADIKKHFEAHREANVGQVSIQPSHDTLDELMS